MTAPVRLLGKDRAIFQALLIQVQVGRERVAIHCDAGQIAKLLLVEATAHAPERITLTTDVRLRRSGRAMRLIQDNGIYSAAKPDSGLVRLLTQAHRWWAELQKGEVNITMLCDREKVSDAWMSRVLRLAFPSPAITRSILKGTQPDSIDTTALLATRAVAVKWREQEQNLLMARL